MRLVAFQRKNPLFARHELRAEIWEAVATLFQPCKLLAINPNGNLADLFARIVAREGSEPINDLPPGNWTGTKTAEAALETNGIAKAALAHDFPNFVWRIAFLRPTWGGITAYVHAGFLPPTEHLNL
jgi:hypothetical protein